MEYSKLLDELPPTRLALLLDVQTLSEWQEFDSEAILDHQLHAPLIPDLLEMSDGRALRPLLEAMAVAGSPSFLMALASPQTNVRILEAIKHFAQDIQVRADHPSHGEPAMVLYYSAIAAALVHARRRITTLTDEELKVGLEWALLRATFRELQELLTTGLAVLGD